MKIISRKLVVWTLGVVVLAGCQGDRKQDIEERAMPVRAEKMVPGTFAPSVLLFGTVRPAVTFPLTAGPGGRLRYNSRFANGLRTGERVKRGEVLGWIENEGARLGLAEAKLRLQAAESELKRSQAALELGIESAAVVEGKRLSVALASEALRAATTTSARTSIVSPGDGYLMVSQVLAPGSEVPAGAVIAELAQSGRARVEAWAAAADRERIRPGLAAMIRGRSSGEDVSSRIVEVAEVVDDGGTVKVVAEPETLDGLPAPGEGVELLVTLPEQKDVFILPEEAMAVGSGGEAVYRVEQSNFGLQQVARARKVNVTVVGRGDGRVAIASGLRQGDLVVIKGAESLADSVFVSVAEEKEGGQ